MKIKEMPELERPRERLIKYGVSALSNEELLAILLKTGSKNNSAKDLSLDILKEYETLENLKNATCEQLETIKGIGEAKALTILSSIELGKRIYLNKNSNKKEIFTTSNQIHESMKYLLKDKKQEYFYCLYLNNKKELIERKLLFMGTINRSTVHPREVFKYAYLHSASAIICVHNHPSGDINPSREDIRFTESLVELGMINGIPVIDHLIIGDDKYYSFYEEGKILNM